MAHPAESNPTPTTGTICQTGEEEDENHAKRPIIIVNFDRIMDEVKATTKDVFSCTDDNMTKTHLFLDSHTIATLQVLHLKLRSRLQGMITYGSAISKESDERYNHLHAEATRALINIVLFEAAGTIITLPTNFDGVTDLGGGNPKIKQIEESSTNPDDFMDTGRQTLIGVITTDNLGKVEIGEDNTQATDDQILEIGVPQNDMDLLWEDTMENGVTPLSEMTETLIPASTCATGNLRARTAHHDLQWRVRHQGTPAPTTRQCQTPSNLQLMMSK